MQYYDLQPFETAAIYALYYIILRHHDLYTLQPVSE